MAQRDEWFQSKRNIPVTAEYEHWNYLKAGKEPATGPDTAGDCDKFGGAGFMRRLGDPGAPLRAAATVRLDSRLADHDSIRRPHLAHNISVRYGRGGAGTRVRRGAAAASHLSYHTFLPPSRTQRCLCRRTLSSRFPHPAAQRL